MQIRSRPTDKAAKAREDYYQNRPTLGDGHWRGTLKADSAAGKECTTRRLQIISRPADKTAKARKKDKSPDP